MESILTSIKKLLGIEEDYIQFDQDIIMAINTALFALMQLGIGPTAGFSISDKTPKWIDLLGNKTDIEGVKSYVYLKTRLMFDPPTIQALIDAMNRQISELEWRLNVQVEPPVPTTTTTTTDTTTTVGGGTV